MSASCANDMPTSSGFPRAIGSAACAVMGRHKLAATASAAAAWVILIVVFSSQNVVRCRLIQDRLVDQRVDHGAVLDALWPRRVAHPDDRELFLRVAPPVGA